MKALQQKGTMLAVIGLILAALVGAGGWVTVKIFTRPGPRQIELARQEAEKKAMTAEQKKAMEMEEKINELKKKAEALPPFKEPADGLIPPDRMRIFADIRYSMVTAMRDEEKTWPPPPRSVTTGFALAARMVMVVNGTQFTKLIENNMNAKEHDWIDRKVNDATIIDLLKLEQLTEDSEQKAKIHNIAQFLAVSNGYSSPGANGGEIGEPERVDPNSVPPQHQRYILEYYKKLGFTGAEIDTLDWTPLLKAEGMPVQ